MPLPEKLQIVGFWSDSDDPDRFIDPKLLVGRFPTNVDKEKFSAYLRNGIRFNEQLGFSYCRLDASVPEEEMGNADLTDGTWMWPEGLHIYVERFAIGLPCEFITHVMKNQYVISCPLTRRQLETVRKDIMFWEGWCSGFKHQCLRK